MNRKLKVFSFLIVIEEVIVVVSISTQQSRIGQTKPQANELYILK